MMPLLYFKWYIGAILVFIGLHLLQNLWRPMLISRFDSCSRPETGATILSIESQAKSLFTIVMAPILGYSIDYINRGTTDQNFWPIAVLGLIAAISMLSTKSVSCDVITEDGILKEFHS